MKRDLEHLDLKQAFHPVPEACHRALMDAARSVREEKPVKRVSYRAALIAAVILLAAMAVAYAAVRLGWIEYFSQLYGIAVPRAAQEALEASQPKACQVGPMTFTYQQLLTDRRIVLSSAAVSLTDGGEALYADDTNVYESISAISDTVASRYSLTDHSMTWLEAAQELELPLYGVRALVELPPESDLGSSMEDALWNEDGTIVYFNMPMLAPGSAAGDVNATLYMAVTQFDPATGEALEKWPLDLMRSVVPEIVDIICRIDQKLKLEHPNLFIVKDNTAHMANLSIYVGSYINGVAEIHTQILKNDCFKDWYYAFPERFQNKTNGITPRRWLGLCNPELTAMLREKVGGDFLKNLDLIGELKDQIYDETVVEFNDIKHLKKEQLCAVIAKHEGVTLNPDFIFDVQVKRLHEYKRQLMNILSIVDIYFRLKEGRLPDFHPTVYLFGAKSAPGYARAKAIIRYINRVAKLINSDSAVADKLKVVFVQNYNCSYAEHIIPAADISEQISPAGTEASGTGNMKLMLNGAVTLGTLDGANVEIAQEAGRENEYIFGHTVDEINAAKPTYHARGIYDTNADLRRAINTLVDGTVPTDDAQKELFHSLLDGTDWHQADHYFLLLDYASYFDTKLQANRDYADRIAFGRKCLMNVASAAKFSSDRTIRQYAEEIWHIKPTEY